MSGEWIKVEVSLPSKSEVIRLGRILGLPTETVCGYLIRFWGWASANSVDGSVTQLALRDIDMIVTLPGFADAMVSVGWLRYEVESDRIVVPNFTRHNGDSAKKRALTTKRQQRYRNAVVDASVTLSASPEKRREEKRSKPRVEARATRLPDSWTLPEPWLIWTRTEKPGWPIPFIQGVADRFKDYWIAKAGKDGVSLDWEATWRNWVRREGDPAGASKTRQQELDDRNHESMLKALREARHDA